MSDTTHAQSQFYIRIDGNVAPEAMMLDLIEVSVESSLHLPDVAVLTLHDPHLLWIDDARLEPGRTIEIHAQVGATKELLFDGEVVELEPELHPGDNRLLLRAFDRLHRLSQIRHVRSFENVSDGDLVRKLAAEAGLEARVGSARHVYPYVAQANESNLSFLQSRAAALGYLLFADGKTLCCVPPESEGQPVALDWSSGLREFRPRLTAVGQVRQVTVRGWDPIARRAIVGQAQDGQGAPSVGERRSGGELARQAFNLDAEHLVADRPIGDQKLADWLAQAVADRFEERFIVAEGSCSGHPTITAGTAVHISGVGKRFGGTYLVTSAMHHYSPSQGYSTTFAVSGQHPTSLLSMLNTAPAVRPGSFLVIGIVSDTQDPENLGRVRVSFPWLSDRHTSDWARVVAVGGGAERGIQFIPEIDDEVLVGFELGDIHHPYILGGLWNGRDKPPEDSADLVKSGKVLRRIIQSRSGHRIVLDDSEDAERITIEDRNGNSIVLDSASNVLTLKAKGDIEIAADQQVKIKGKKGVTIDSDKGNIDIRGKRINLN